MVATNQNLTLHVRFDGRSFDVPLNDLDAGRLSADNDVKLALARYLDLSVDKLRAYVVDRHETGNLTLRPEAVFG